MKLIVLQENLSKALETVSRAVATRTTLPILGNVLLQTDGSRLRLTATNLDVTISRYIGAKVEQEGAITVPARLFAEYVKSIPNDKVELSLDNLLHVKAGRYKAKFNVIAADDFPPIPQVEGVEFELTLGDVVRRLKFAAATEETRPVLTGVSFGIKDGVLSLAAADGFRLAEETMPVSFDTLLQCIIPAKALGEVERLDQVTLVIGNNQVLFKAADTEIVSTLLAGTFPNYEQLFPKEFTSSAVVMADELERAVRMAFLFARDNSGIVRIVSGDGRLTLSASASEAGDGTADVDAQVTGEVKVALNARYLLDMLAVMDGKLSMHVNSATSPVLFTGGGTYRHLIMPMSVQW